MPHFLWYQKTVLSVLGTVLTCPEVTWGSLHWATLPIERLREVRHQFFESSILYRVGRTCRQRGYG